MSVQMEKKTQESPVIQGSPAPGPINQNATQMTPQLQEQLKQLEVTAEKMYNSVDAQERQKAQAALRLFSTSAACIPQCQLILDNSQSYWALVLASSGLVKLVTTFWNKFTAPQTLEIRNYVLNYLGRHLGRLPPPVVANLVQLVARVAKLGWTTEPQHREITKDMTMFLKTSIRHCILALQILNELVQQMNTVLGQSLTKHRKIACSFRDSSLFYVFQLALTNLQQIYTNQLQINNAQEASQLKSLALQLCLRCLSFDYIGTNPDETSADFGTIQVPSSWSPVFEDPKSLDLFFGLLGQLSGENATVCMEVIVEFASVRRSIFRANDKRTQFITHLCTKTADFLIAQQNNAGVLNNRDVFHHFCRLLDRMKSNYTLKELIAMPRYAEWIELVAKFTINSFRNIGWNSNSIHYLVGLWARLTLATPYMKAMTSSFLENFIPQVSQALMSARVDAVPSAVNSGEVDDLFAEPDLSDHLRHLATLCRYQYETTEQYIISQVQPLMQQYKRCMEALSLNNNPGPIAEIEAKLALYVHYIGTIIGGHPHQYMSTIHNSHHQKHDVFDANLCILFFKLMPMIEFRLQKTGSIVAVVKHLDLSILAFFEHFRSAFIGYHQQFRQPQKDTPRPSIYDRMSQQLGQTTENNILSGVLKKIAQNLEYWATDNDVIEKSLGLLNRLSMAYHSAKIVAKLDTCKQLLGNHFERFKFMKVMDNAQLRTDFYRIISRVLFDNENVDMFDDFMRPFEQMCGMISQQANPRSEDVLRHGIGLCADLTGMFEGAKTKKAYCMLFDWACPKVTAVLLRLLETWWDKSAMSTPVLKFFAEFSKNFPSHRISFGSSSADGIILFREASKAITLYGYQILKLTQPPEDLYEDRLRGIFLCVEILTNTLKGDYCNFGVFALYNDKCFDNALNAVLKLILSVSLDSVLSYTDIALSYYTFLEALLKSNSAMLLNLDTKVFLAIFSSLVDSIDHHDKTISIKCCDSLNYLFTYRVEQGQRRNPVALVAKFDAHMESSGDLCQIAMSTLFNVFLFSQAEHLWYFTRPIFSLLLYRNQLLQTYVNQLAQSQTQEAATRLRAAFPALMENVRPRLDDVNRDKFTQNCHNLRFCVLKYCVKPSYL